MKTKEWREEMKAGNGAIRGDSSRPRKVSFCGQAVGSVP